jgi:mono/diheme cytochrome c family protein
MRHTDVSRFSLALAALLAAAALAFAWIVGPAEAREPGGAGAGERLFSLRCGACHVSAELAASLRDHPDRDAAVRALLEYLGGHGDASAPEARAIVEHLRALAER